MAYFLHETKAWILIHRRMIFLILSHEIFVATKIVHRHQLFVTKTRILIINFLLSTRAYRFSICLGTFYWSEYNFCLLLSHWFYGISISPFFSFRYLYRPNSIDFSLLSHGRGFGALGCSAPLYEQFIQKNTGKFKKKHGILGYQTWVPDLLQCEISWKNIRKRIRGKKDKNFLCIEKNLGRFFFG